MKRILFSIVVFTILFTSCASQNSGDNAESPAPEAMQTILSFNNNFEGDSDSKTREKKLRDTIYLSSSLEEKQKKLLIKEYLQKSETYKDAPDSVTYDNGRPLVEHYSEEAKGKMSFIFYLYGSPSGIQVENADATQNAIICTTINSSDFQNIGYLSYTCDSQQRTSHESLLDTKKNLVAAIDYEYLSSLPFPFITKYEDTGNNTGIAADVLNINQKFWIYKEYTEFDNDGKWTAYTADLYNNNPGRDFTCTYDTSGKLVKIADAANNKSDILNEINLTYQKNGLLRTVGYTRPDAVYGTADSFGKIHYDDQGRMIYRENYITHGTQYTFYLYDGEAKRPWLSIALDSEIWGNVADGADFGNPVNAYLFQEN